jgi:predicted transcriptional regulator
MDKPINCGEGTIARQILDAIADGHNTAAKLHLLDFARGTVGNYLRRLEKAGLIESRVEKIPRLSFWGETRHLKTKVYFTSKIY